MGSSNTFMDSFPSPFKEEESSIESVIDDMDFFSNWGKKLGSKDNSKVM